MMPAFSEAPRDTGADRRDGEQFPRLRADRHPAISEEADAFTDGFFIETSGSPLH